MTIEIALLTARCEQRGFVSEVRGLFAALRRCVSKSWGDGFFSRKDVEAPSLAQHPESRLSRRLAGCNQPAKTHCRIHNFLQANSTCELEILGTR